MNGGLDFFVKEKKGIDDERREKPPGGEKA